MPKFGKSSRERLDTCHPDLQRLFEEVVKHFDCRVTCGHRDRMAQMIAYQENRSKLPWPQSKHNQIPSTAVDVVPYPVDWKDIHRFYYFAGFVKGVAKFLGIPIRWGGDWDSDTEVDDQTFNDLPHFELKGGGNTQ